MGLQQKKSSKAEQVRIFCTKKFLLTEPFSEKYLKKVFGHRTDIEDSLERLDNLTPEEAQMSAAQVLKATHAVDDTGRVKGVADIALSVDNEGASIDERMVVVDERMADVDERVVGVGVRVATVEDRVNDVGDQVKTIYDKLVAVIDGARYIFNQSSEIIQLLMHIDGIEVTGVIRQTADGVDQVKRLWFLNPIHDGHAGSIILTENQLRQDLHGWLSPPDPSTNHNIACNAHHKGTATWFFEGRTYKEWKSTGSNSLLWVHGKRVPHPILLHDAT